MRIAVFDTHRHDRASLDAANAAFGHELVFLEPRLDARTAALAAGFPAVCSFVNDRVDRAALARLREGGVRLVALRSAGFNHVDLEAAAALGIAVVRVPEYSPYAVAEHAVALVLALNRKIHRAHARVREGNFVLDGLLGFDLHGKTAGIVGTGRIGRAAAQIFAGFGCRVIAYDREPSPELQALGVAYAALDELYARADVISLHVPLTPSTRHDHHARERGRVRARRAAGPRGPRRGRSRPVAGDGAPRRRRPGGPAAQNTVSAWSGITSPASSRQGAPVPSGSLHAVVEHG